MQSPPDERFCFNGVDAVSGRPLLPALSAAALARLARGLPLDADAVDLQHQRAEQPFVTAEDVDPRRVDAAGWAVIFAHDADPDSIAHPFLLVDCTIAIRSASC